MKDILTKGVLLLSMTMALLACKKDDSCTVTFDTTGAFVHDWGQSVTVTFTTSNVKSISTSATDGWSASADLASHTVVITAPESADAEDAALRANVTLSATSSGGETSSATINVYIVDQTIDLSADGTSNSYIITAPDNKYRISVNRKGETDERLAVASAAIVWQSSKSLIKHLTYDAENESVEFYVGYADDSDTELTAGNALIAACNDADEIIWSWHLWLVNSDPRDGGKFMDRNLGAYINSDGSTDEEDILASYGLYYQWGRKEPLMRPRYYNCANSTDEIVYTETGSFVYVTVEQTDAEKGTMAYAVANPTVMLTAPDTNDGDWLWGGDSSLWGENGDKTIYDPCPKGWRVPSREDLQKLARTASDDTEQLAKAYGLHLADSEGTVYFFPGDGYRSYFDGLVSNITFENEYPYTPLPWIGCYWSRSTVGTDARAMLFDSERLSTRAAFDAPDSERYRANAMQIRCVKIE